MAKLNAAQAEQQYKISRMTLGRWIKTGKLMADKNGRFSEEALRAALVEKSPRGRKPKMHGPAVPPESAAARSPADDESTERPDADILEQSRHMDVRLKSVKLARERMRYYEDIKRSIPYEIVERAYNVLGGILEEQFRAFAERNGEALIAIIKSGKPAEFVTVLQREIDSGIKSVLAQTERSLGTMRGEAA
jgi:hypothetical protein